MYLSSTFVVLFIRCHLLLVSSLSGVSIPDIGLGVRVFANGPGDLGSIPGRVIPKTQKMVLDASLLNTQHYKIRIKGKVEQSREGVAPSPTHWCSSYRKGSLRITLDYGRQQLYQVSSTFGVLFMKCQLLLLSSLSGVIYFWCPLYEVPSTFGVLFIRCHILLVSSL